MIRGIWPIYLTIIVSGIVKGLVKWAFGW